MFVYFVIILLFKFPQLGAYLTGLVNSASPDVVQGYKLLITIR